MTSVVVDTHEALNWFYDRFTQLSVPNPQRITMHEIRAMIGDMAATPLYTQYLQLYAGGLHINTDKDLQLLVAKRITPIVKYLPIPPRAVRH